MKTYYGVFYKKSEKWYGPILGDLFENKKAALEHLQDIKEGLYSNYYNRPKNKMTVFKQKWTKV